MATEIQRLDEARSGVAPWKKWGPYLSERAWGTVREDYSALGQAWSYFPHAHARSKAYRWNEDGLGGICDEAQQLCFAIAVWNERDAILKERLFGVTGPEGNHGEDVKELYYYLDSTPTHSYMKFLYKYPQAAYPYDRLVEESRKRDRKAPEFELVDSGVFAEERYFDVVAEYAKAAPEDLLITLSVTNRGPEPARMRLLPTVWFRNTWSWQKEAPRPEMRAEADGAIAIAHVDGSRRWLYAEGGPELLFTENETNDVRVHGADANPSPHVKDAFHDYVVQGRRDAVNPRAQGTKAAAHYQLALAPGETAVVRLRLVDSRLAPGAAFADFDALRAERVAEADAFYQAVLPAAMSDDERLVARQAFAGMLWTKQFFHFDVDTWLEGDPAFPPPSAERKRGRNREWRHLNVAHVVSMPDKWEYPWFAAWDLAFHCVPLALVDPDFAKEQLLLLVRELAMHPNGQLPAYEWNFGDVNPPVHAWASWKVYQMERARVGRGDRLFLERVFHKLLLNFTWWVNRKDTQGNNVFEGGFLGLDNIGVFDRSSPLPTGGFIEQSDGTSWMAMFTLNMLRMALELATDNPAYEDVACKFFEHFVAIDHAMHHLGDGTIELWDEADGFYYDVLHLPDGGMFRLRLRSMVGLIPLFAVEVLEPELLERLPGFKAHVEGVLASRRAELKASQGLLAPGEGGRRMLSIVDPEQLRRVLARMLDEGEFLAPHGVRSLSKAHRDQPYVLQVGHHQYRVDYLPGESDSGMFGGNSNWRGPIWFPVNYLLIESLRSFHQYLGPSFKVECPVGAATQASLPEVADEIARRLTRLFLRDPQGRRAVFGADERFQHDPHFRDHVLFYEYFHGDHGQGLGASHQTGWTGLVANLLIELAEGGWTTANVGARSAARVEA